MAAAGAAGYGPVALLWLELARLDTAAPERDAAAMLAQGRAACYSVPSYPRYFPGAKTVRDTQYCERIEKAFPGPLEVPFGELHFRLTKQAARYALAFNRYVLGVGPVQRVDSKK
jgi:hypothetical protein